MSGVSAEWRHEWRKIINDRSRPIVEVAKKTDDNEALEAPKEEKPTISAPNPIGKDTLIANTTTNRLTKAIKADIIAHIVGHLIANRKKQVIVRETAERYGISERHGWRFLAKAQAAFSNLQPAEIAKARLDQHLTARKALLGQCDHPRDKLEILKDMARLERLYDDTMTIRHTQADNIDTDTLISIANGNNT